MDDGVHVGNELSFVSDRLTEYDTYSIEYMYTVLYRSLHPP